MNLDVTSCYLQTAYHLSWFVMVWVLLKFSGIPIVFFPICFYHFFFVAYMKYYDNPGGMIPTWVINWGAKVCIKLYLNATTCESQGYCL